jgi:hypothetical protein
MTAPRETGGRAAANFPALLWLPVAWLIARMAMAARYMWAAWPALNDYSLPAGATNYIYGEMIASVLAILLGLYVLALALAKSRLFAMGFTIWQVFVLIAIIALMAYTYVQPDFVIPLMTYVFFFGEILLGLICIVIVRSTPITAKSASPGEPSPATSILARIIYCLLGIVAGGFAGFWVGFAVGAAIADVTQMSCFEGACGYFAALIAVVGILVGAIVGIVLALYWSRPRKPKPMVTVPPGS